MVEARPDAAPAPAKPGGSPLDLQEGISTPTEWGCTRWPPELRLRSTLDHLVLGRCKATNLCDYCARLAAVENAEMLALDATYGIAPRVWVVLTTPRADPEPKSFYLAREKLMKALRRRFRHLAYCCIVEFTTGYGANSGGLRRPHWNLLLKGVGPEHLDAVREVIAKVWCPRVDGSPEAQFVGSIEEHGGLMKYLALHFQKESQKPEPGWRGHRFIPSRDGEHAERYLWLPTSEARDAARRSLRLKREIWKAEKSGLRGEAALEAAHLALYEADELAWELVRATRLPTEFDADGMPSAWTEALFPVLKRARSPRPALTR